MRTVARNFNQARLSALAPWDHRASFEASYLANAEPQTVEANPVAMAAAAPQPSLSGTGHPLADDRVSTLLWRRAAEIEAAFAAIEPALRSLAPAQFDDAFPERASQELLDRLGVSLQPEELQASWAAPLDMRQVYARCVLETFCNLIERGFDRDLANLSEGENAEALIRRWGFHAIDITPCADGRLSGVLDYILRIPPAVVACRKSYAGAMFDVAESLRNWETVELKRWRDGLPNRASEPTRYLKIGVYHFSSADPSHEGCAAHGSDEARAASSVLERLEQFEQALEAIHSCGASVAILLVGVDTDTDAIRVHIPNAAGQMSPDRFADSRRLYSLTQGMARNEAKAAIRDAVAVCAGVPADDAATEGMRWFCGYLLKNNIAQVDAVLSRHGGQYADRGHAERLIIAGDAVDDVQLRNLAFQAQMETVEEGARDLDVGIGILHELHGRRGLAVPLLAHVLYDPRIPGGFERAQRRAGRLSGAILSRYADLGASGFLHVRWLVRPLTSLAGGIGGIGGASSNMELAA